MKHKTFVALFCVAGCLGLVFLAACSSGPKKPEPGTPAFSWSAARDAYRANDYQNVASSLAKITNSDNEYTVKARAWEIVNAAGMAQAYSALADIYEDGAKRNRQNPLPFRKQVTVFRNAAQAAALQLTEAYHKFTDVDKDPNVVLAFDPPLTDAPEPENLKKVSTGMPIPDAELARTETAMLQRGMMLAVKSAVGAKDAAQAAEIVKSGQVPRETFLLGVAKMIYDTTDLFGPKKLDLPNRTKMLCQEAMEALKVLPASAQTKDLTSKIQTLLKKRNLTI